MSSMRDSCEIARDAQLSCLRRACLGEFVEGDKAHVAAAET